MMNKVFLVGRITRDPELRQNSNNTPYVFFTVAINRLPNPNGERQADFISCVAWGKQAENLARFIRKGGLIGVDGTLQSRTINDNNQQRTIMEVNASNITFLESRGASDNPQGNYNQGYDNNMYRPQPQPNPQYNRPMNNNYNQQNSYNNNYNRNMNQPMNNNYNNNGFNQMNNEPSNPFAQEAQEQFTLSDDDLPF